MFTEHGHVSRAKGITGVEIVKVFLFLLFPWWCALAVDTLPIVSKCREEVEFRMILWDFITLLINVRGVSRRGFRSMLALLFG